MISIFIFYMVILRCERRQINPKSFDVSSETTILHRLKNRNRHRKTKFNKKQRARKIRIRNELERVAKVNANLATYQKWSMREKINFANRGYIFDNCPDEPAIVLSQTTIMTPEGMERCVKAGTSLPYLPVEFLVLFSWSEISEVPADGMQSFYQLALPYDLVLFMHTEPSTPHGLANFINAAVSAPTRSGPEYKSKVREITAQNMTVQNCKFVNRTHSLNPVFRAANPAYVVVEKKIPSGYELLLPKNYGNKKKAF